MSTSQSLQSQSQIHSYHSRTSGMHRLSPLLSLILACAGCAAEADTATGSADNEAGNEAQTAQAVGLSGGYSWGTTTNGFVSTSIGTGSGRTCFLTGLTGNLGAGLSDETEAGVFLDSAGTWDIFTFHYASEALNSTAQCINAATNRTDEKSWFQGSNATWLASAADPKLRCFLTYVDGNGGFARDSDYVRIWNDGANWWLGGSISGGGGAGAVCVDVNADYGSWEWVAGDPGGFTANLAYNPGGVACLLTGVGGHFTANDWNDGVKITYNGGILTWQMSVVNGKAGWATCVQ